MAIDNPYDDNVIDVATNFPNERDRHVHMIKSNGQVKCPAGGSLPRHTPTSLPKSRPRFNLSHASRAQP